MADMCWSRRFASATLSALLAACGSSPPGPAVVVPPAVVSAPAEQASAIVSTTVVDPAPSPSALADARHLLNRFAFGPRPGEVERVARLGTRRWLEQQLAGPEESPLLEAALVSHRSAFAPPAELVQEWLGEGWEMETRSLRQLREEARPQFGAHVRRLATAELTRNILSSRQVEAVMTSFWANHFNVFADKGLVRVLAGDYLERALRPHALGKFSDLLLATARHPAMLLYLDNAGNRRERRRGKARQGLNENYARELLELHTLGVSGGYTQQDVHAVARILTGWTVVDMKEGGFDFVYRPKLHDAGEKTVLGHLFPAGGQEEEGVRLLELLARHPSTARHLAQRLCERLVADEPPPSCESAAAGAYARSDGDIQQVVRAIAEDASFWSPEVRMAKLKTPLELVASAARALEARPDDSLDLAILLERLGEPLLQERTPTGYPEAEPEWASAGGMLARMAFATELGSGRAAGLALPELAAPPHEPLADYWAERLLGADVSPRTKAIVREATAALGDAEQQRAAAIALLIGSPEFQRQ